MDNGYLVQLLNLQLNAVDEDFQMYLGAGNPLQTRREEFIAEAKQLMVSLTKKYNPVTSRTKARAQRYKIMQVCTYFSNGNPVWKVEANLIMNIGISWLGVSF